jgi:FkbM family methyltransferase
MDTFQLLDDQLSKNAFQRKGIIHIGAHLGEEAETYNRLGFESVIWIEANPELCTQLKRNVSKYGHSVYNCLLSDLDSDAVDFFITNNEGHSSSLLPLGQELVKTGMHVTKRFSLQSARFDTFCHKNHIDVCQYNCVNIDVQGAELKVFNGFGTILNNFDFIITEVSLKRLYRGSVLFHKLDQFLLNNNFVRISTSAIGDMGEALYKRSETPVPSLHKFFSMLSSCFLEVLISLGIPQFFYNSKGGPFRSVIRSFYLRYIRK